MVDHSGENMAVCTHGDDHVKGCKTRVREHTHGGRCVGDDPMDGLLECSTGYFGPVSHASVAKMNII